MKIDDSLGTYEQVFGQVTEKVAAIADCLHSWICSNDPEVVIVPRAGEKSVAYGVGPKKMSEAYCYLMPQKDYLNLGFYHGTSLDDPHALLEGTGNKLRHVKLHSIEAAKQNSVLQLIALAREDRIKNAKVKR